MDASTRFETQVVGALPLVAHDFELLSLGAIIDEVVPWEGEVPLGTLAEIMIANRLLNPKALFKVGDWARKAGLTDYYGLTAEQLNDDRLGRALERLAAQAHTVQAALVLKMIKTFKLDVSQIHYDITSVELYGAYEAAAAAPTPPTPLPTYGRTKSGRKNVKQIQFGLNVTRDGAVPISHVPLDGNTAEAKTHLGNLKQLEQLLPKGVLLYIADTKLDTPENLLGIAARKGQFLCGGAFSPTLQQQYLKCRAQMKPVDYCPKSQAQLPPEKRDAYQACEVKDKLYGEVDGRGIRLKYRLIFVHSAAKARQEAQTRERHVAKIREQFEAVERNLGKYSLPTKTHPTAKTLATYKEQTHVERRFGNAKGPLAVAPMFLEKPARMAGLLCILVWALMVMALMERAIRRNLKGKPLYGLYPENRPSAAPTSTALLECFSTVCIVIVKHHGTLTRRLAQFTPIQHKLIQLLDIPPTALQTFKRRCGM